ncbi:MAG: hypothetical protein PHU98_15285, partial [Mariniphaga sp.]|nr:hypothetical protein [Mariniphaga sp.]
RKQIELYNGIKKSKLAICIDDFRKLNKNQLLYAVSDLSKDEIKNLIQQRQKKAIGNQMQLRYISLFKNLWN